MQSLNRLLLHYVHFKAARTMLVVLHLIGGEHIHILLTFLMRITICWEHLFLALTISTWWHHQGWYRILLWCISFDVPGIHYFVSWDIHFISAQLVHSRLSLLTHLRRGMFSKLISLQLNNLRILLTGDQLFVLFHTVWLPFRLEWFLNHIGIYPILLMAGVCSCQALQCIIVTETSTWRWWFTCELLSTICGLIICLLRFLPVLCNKIGSDLHMIEISRLLTFYIPLVVF
jgi:hypothetical protein